ncbi:hypothetical protein Scep_003111 [Stephania cephalantha]|uniref:Uncharacterized protein n=1 Tax=Stephania cephalantha TaxID=152367 RepID=A0AAP0KPW1_9MAGN
MANPRRLSNNTSSSLSPINPSEPLTAVRSKLLQFLKRPQSLPFLLSLFLLLTWASLRLQHLHRMSQLSQRGSRGGAGALVVDSDAEANLARFQSTHPTQIALDKRGWLINPIRLARDSGLSGVALSCASVHVGEIRPGGIRGNHRHHTCNETFVIWGAETKYRLENPKLDKGYAEVTIDAEEVAVASSSSGTAHALVNVDPMRPTFFLGCQDSSIAPNSSTTDFNIWKDL